MMIVVGVTFSMTLMTLALASSQYTSRILRNFMRDRVTQVVLEIFAGIFTYCQPIRPLAAREELWNASRLSMVNSRSQNVPKTKVERAKLVEIIRDKKKVLVAVNID